MDSARLRGDLGEVDGFRLLRRLGGGAYGEVYVAHDPTLDRAVALKLLLSDDGGLGRGLAEARALARLSHPNVVAVHRVGEAAGRAYLVSELVLGGSLAEVPKPVPFARLVEVARGLTQGLAAAHQRGVLHRDIKPANVLVAEDGTVKLCDFGLAVLDAERNRRSAPLSGAAPVVARAPAVAVDGDATVSLARPGARAVATWKADGAGDAGQQDAAEMASDGHGSSSMPYASDAQVAGTPRYMAPETWRAERPTAASDLYSLGVVLYELACGAPPHAAPSLPELRRAVLEDTPVPLGERVRGIDPRFAALVHRCLAREPADRWASAGELLAALDALGATTTAPVQGSPFRGLSPFEAQHRALFFGRGAEARAVAELLRSEGLVVLAGDSGVGKSSLARAGVMPLVEDGVLGEGRAWRAVALTPGVRPVAALLAALGHGASPADAAALDAEAWAQGVAERFTRHHGVVLLVDQLEELVTVAPAAEAAEAVRLLVALGGRWPGLRVLATARGDYLGRLSALPRFAAPLARALFFVSPLGRDGLREAVVGPLRATGDRFEDDGLVERLVEEATAPGALPLLQFALAELWERRDAERRVLTSASLEAMGGLRGALARHADATLAALPAPERRAARALLLRLVTEEGTRARRGAHELLPQDDTAAAAALQALVRARLVTAQEGDDGVATYEIAHEALVKHWSALALWLAEDDARRVAEDRVLRAAAEWERLGRAAEQLYTSAQLREVERLGVVASDVALPEGARGFLRASAARARRRRLGGWALGLALPLAAGAAVGLYALRAKVALEASLRDRQGQAARSLAEARRIEAESDAERTRALELFDADDHDTGETTYGEARRLALQADAHLHEAAQVLEGALLVEPSRPEVRQGLAEVLLQRAELAERWHRRELLATILERLATVDDGGAVLARWHAPASLAIASEPAGAALTLCEYREAEGRLGLHACRAVGPAPQTLTLPPGSYRVTLELPARPSVVYPVALRRAERLEASVPMPEVVPEGFVYVPPGRFLYGSNEPDEVRQVFAAPPLHEARTDGFFIAVHEVTFGEWLTYLRSLPEPERSHRTPSSSHFGASVQLRREPDGRYGLQLTPASRTYAAAEGEPLLYAGRARRAQQDWLRLPVTGVSPLDAEAYARWLAARIPLPGVRLCTEREWERAARGADARRYPHGQELAPEDANIDLTYGRVPEAFGPDEVGTYPASRSPFGVEDMAGNVWEIVRAGEEFVLRGGGFYQTAQAASAWNSDHAAAGSRDTRMGLRLCADARVHLVPWAGSRREAAD